MFIFSVLKQPVQFSVGLELGCLKSSIPCIYVMYIACELLFCFSGKGDDIVVDFHVCLTFTG